MTKNLFSKILKVINKNFIVFLLIIVSISLGQMIFMDVWQDDQALFFKLAHINEPAGFFGDGPFGAGPYRYAATPFIPIYHFFKFNTYAYFTFMLILYGIATIAIYKTFKLILGDTAGKVSGFLFAAGYITSDGAYRMANSVTTSISVIFLALILYAYWKYLKKRKIIWYFLALIFFFLSQELAITRMHYFFAVIVLFEFVYFVWGNSIKKIPFAILRLLPFSLIFYNFMVLGGDPRVEESSAYFFAFLNNQLYLYYGFFASLANLIIPDWLLKPLFNLLLEISTNLGYSNISRVLLITLGLTSIITAFFLFKKSWKIRIASILLIVTWLLFARKAFNTPFLSLSPQDYFSAYIGGIILVIYLLSVFYFEKVRKFLIFFGLWLIGNVIAYSAYFPTVAYETTNRYLTHSFLPLVALYGLIFSICIKKKGITKYIAYLIVVFAFLNIFASIQYQQNILISRSYKTKSFYNQLRILLPEIKKGDVLYFDLSNSNEGTYRDAITAAMMPDTTAMAWRYGIDRYDFKLSNDFNELLKIISEEKKNSNQIHSFWFSGENLILTTPEIRNYLQGLASIEKNIELSLESQPQLQDRNNLTTYSIENIEMNLKDPVKNSTPLILSLNIKATPVNPETIIFPLINNTIDDQTKLRLSSLSNEKINQYFDYQEFKRLFYSNIILKTSSDWQNRISQNLIDQDPTSVWQSDRVLWKDSRAVVEIELPFEEEVSRLVWINGFPNNTPTDYTIEASQDGENWTKITSVSKKEKIIDTKPQVISFKPTRLKFIRLVITATIGGDSPSLSEIWITPSKFNDLDIEEAENYLANPFLYVRDKQHFYNLLNLTSNKGKAIIFWKNDKNIAFQTNKDAQINIIYDGISREYDITIPAGGLNLYSVMLSGFTIPGEISISKASTIVKPYKSMILEE